MSTEFRDTVLQVIGFEMIALKEPSHFSMKFLLFDLWPLNFVKIVITANLRLGKCCISRSSSSYDVAM